MWYIALKSGPTAREFIYRKKTLFGPLIFALVDMQILDEFRRGCLSKRLLTVTLEVTEGRRSDHNEDLET